VRLCCPICQKVIENAPADFEPRPFCSLRCKQIDLGNWLDEKYRISEPIGPDDMQEMQDDESELH
jgi:endogenous inhibitor of DNA gyrase (YacG/DUF329 family)